MNLTRRQKKANAKAKAADHSVVQYTTIRDRFLVSADKTDEIEWLVAVGRFVQDRWLAEENECGGTFDETLAWPVWDRCTEKQLRDLRTEAGSALKEYVAAKGIVAIREWAATTLNPLRGFMKGVKWVLEQSLRAIVGAIALIVVGIVLVLLAPGFVKRAHGTLDAVLRPTEAGEATARAG